MAAGLMGRCCYRTSFRHDRSGPVGEGTALASYAKGPGFESRHSIQPARPIGRQPAHGQMASALRRILALSEGVGLKTYYMPDLFAYVD